jgi:hypothetical protein
VLSTPQGNSGVGVKVCLLTGRQLLTLAHVTRVVCRAGLSHLFNLTDQNTISFSIPHENLCLDCWRCWNESQFGAHLILSNDLTWMIEPMNRSGQPTIKKSGRSGQPTIKKSGWDQFFWAGLARSGHPTLKKSRRPKWPPHSKEVRFKGSVV